jgi:hypothetical protein
LIDANANLYMYEAPGHWSEVIRGALITNPRPASPHAGAATRLSRRLGPFDEDNAGRPDSVPRERKCRLQIS